MSLWSVGGMASAGAIEGAEVAGLARWLWESFHVHGESLSAEEQAEKVQLAISLAETSSLLCTIHRTPDLICLLRKRKSAGRWSEPTSNESLGI